MMSRDASFQPDPALIQRICDAHGLGRVETLTPPGRGGVNDGVVVNGRVMIRFERAFHQDDRFTGEKLAYDLLAGSGVPVPARAILDTSRHLAPTNILITALLPGQPVIDSWGSLAGDDRAQVARQAGEHLAAIHTRTFRRFGKLRDVLAGEGFDRWDDYVGDHVERYSHTAQALGGLQDSVAGVLRRVFGQAGALLAEVTTGSLLHSDYHFENILQRGGAVTGVVDFEWAMTGDPAWDFIVEDKWEAMCPGSREHVVAGYTGRRALAVDHPRRVALYKAIMHLETVVMALRQGDVVGYDQAHRAMLDALAAAGR
jgi:aminoglycoside phosphotransferase (APT) family kinase protein